MNVFCLLLMDFCEIKQTSGVSPWQSSSSCVTLDFGPMHTYKNLNKI